MTRINLRATILVVPGLSRESLRGYVLEEILAGLIRNAGYRLLVDESQDTEELQNRANGLAVRGRGGAHQVDVLGELAWIPAFTFPLRLIIEAKARQSTTGLDAVRNAVGVVTDVNQNYTRMSPGRRAPLQKFSYRYALFSSSGFSPAAAEFALAHQISLVDLSSSEFDDLVSLASDVTDLLWHPQPPSRIAGFVKNLRTRLRMTLGTWPEELLSDITEIGDQPPANWPLIAARLREGMSAIGELFVGMANGPYLLLLRAADPQRAITALDADPVQPVEISWSSRRRTGTEWVIRPMFGEDGFQLTFTLPAPVAEWIFDEDADSRRRALQFKEQFLSTITIYRYIDGRDRLYRLRFSRERVSRTWLDRPPR